MNTNFRRSVVYFLLAIIITGFASVSCAQENNPGYDSTAVRIHILTEPESLNPLTSYSLEEAMIESQIFEYLLRMDPKTRKFVPWLAEKLPVESADHKQFDFTLRKGVFFSDGKELTGNDVIFSLKAMKNPFNSKGSNVRSYADVVQSAELIDGDPYHVRVRLSKAGPFISQELFASALQILPKHVFDPHGLTDKYSWGDIAAVTWSTPGIVGDSMPVSSNGTMKIYGRWVEEFGKRAEDQMLMVGSGPYKLKQWAPNDRIILERNDKYASKGNYRYGTVYPDQLVYVEIVDWNSAVRAMAINTVDVMGYVPVNSFITLDTAYYPMVKKQENYQDQYAVLGWNLERPYFKDKKVRLALAHLIDRKTIIDSVLHGMGKPTQSPVFFDNPEYNRNLPLISYNPDTAKVLLKEAGWMDHDGDGIIDKTIDGKSVPFSFSFLVNAGNDIRMQILLLISDALRKAGIDAKVEPVDWSVFLDRIHDHNFDARYGAWASTLPENDSYMLYHSSQSKDGGANYDSWNNAKADRLLEAIRNEFDDSKRYTLQREFQQVLYEDQPEAILWVPCTPILWSKRFEEPEFFSSTISFDPSQWKLRTPAK